MSHFHSHTYKTFQNSKWITGGSGGCLMCHVLCGPKILRESKYLEGKSLKRHTIHLMYSKHSLTFDGLEVWCDGGRGLVFLSQLIIRMLDVLFSFSFLGDSFLLLGMLLFFRLGWELIIVKTSGQCRPFAQTFSVLLAGFSFSGNTSILQGTCNTWISTGVKGHVWEKSIIEDRCKRLCIKCLIWDDVRFSRHFMYILLKTCFLLMLQLAF